MTLISILILSFNLRLGLASDHFPSISPPNPYMHFSPPPSEITNSRFKQLAGVLMILWGPKKKELTSKQTADNKT
jgi:hypothetical protein